MSKLFKIFFPLAIACLPVSLQAFGLWQCAGMLIPELNPLCWDVCGFEVGAELLYLKRGDDSKPVDFTSRGVAGPIVLNSEGVGLGWEKGFKLMGQVNLRGQKAVELVWMPEICWKKSQEAVDPNNELYSIYSRFGVEGVRPETDQSRRQEIALKSGLQTVEVNVRKMWGIFHGDFLYGYRYQSLNESLKYETRGQADTNWYNSETEALNDMHGFQLGAQFYIPYSSRFAFEFFGKGAVYANCSQCHFVCQAGTLAQPLKQEVSSTRTSWGIDAGARVLYEWFSGSYLSLGYQYLGYYHVALAMDNFLPESPLDTPLPERKVANDARISYHGISIGASFIW